MPIRRHIVIDEIDDSADIHSPTNAPMMPAERLLVDPEKQTQTEFPSEDSETETPPSYDTRPSVSTIGRTFPDLVVEFKNDNRMMVIILTFIPIIVFVTKAISVESLLYALSVAAILNVLWFGIPFVSSLFKNIKRRSVKI